MRRLAIKFIILALLLGMAIFVYGLFCARPPVSLTILNCTTNRLADATAAQLGCRTYIRALIGVTNNSSRSFTYLADDSVKGVEYEILRETPESWMAPRGFRCGTGLTQQPLLPSQGITFEAFIGSAERCKVEFSYYDGRKPNPIWQRLPAWMTQRVPWARPWRTATTDVIDLRGPRT